MYQRLTVLGWSHARTTALVAVAMFLTATLGTLSLVVSAPTRVASDVAIGVILVLYATFPRRVTLRQEARQRDGMTLAP